MKNDRDHSKEIDTNMLQKQNLPNSTESSSIPSDASESMEAALTGQAKPAKQNRFCLAS